MPSFVLSIENKTPMVAEIIDVNLQCGTADRPLGWAEGSALDEGRLISSDEQVVGILNLQPGSKLVDCKLQLQLGTLPAAAVVEVEFGVQQINGALQPFGGVSSPAAWLAATWDGFTDPGAPDTAFVGLVTITAVGSAFL